MFSFHLPLLDPAVTYKQQSPFKVSCWKFTIAQHVSSHFGNWVRPQIRVFATYAKWKGPENLPKAVTMLNHYVVTINQSVMPLG